MSDPQGEKIVQTRFTRTVTIAPGHFYEFSLTVPESAAGLTFDRDAADAISLQPGDTAVIRVRCLPSEAPTKGGCDRDLDDEVPPASQLTETSRDQQ